MATERRSEAEIKELLKQLGVTLKVDLGTGLYVADVPINCLREQDINARIMDDGVFKQLVSNIKKRGTLESLPFCAVTGKGVEIISGHHRVKAAREAGVKLIAVLLDISGLNRSQIAAKQLAHNAISGIDDQNTLKEIAKLITDVDDMLESAIDRDIFKEQRAEIERLATPAVEIDWKTVQFTFLPHQVKDLEKLVEKTAEADIEGVASIEQFAPFVEALEKTKKFEDVKAVGTAVYMMTKATLEKIGENGYGDDDMEYVALTKIFGGGAIPKEYAAVIEEAVKKMASKEEIDSKKKWQAIACWASMYLNENK